MDSPDGGPGFFRLRSYQAEMVEESLKQNVIVAMDTGSGKTHVAISRTAAELEICEPEQLVWFIAPTVTLCHQQSCLFEKYLPAYQLRFLSGNDNVDRWTDQSVWDAILRNIRVVISTPAVLLDALTHGFVKLSKIALLIFDEAHMCRGNHPASAIMQNFYHPLMLSGQRDQLPKILGLTASPVVSAKADGLEVIERSLNAIAKTPKINRTELLRFTHRPELVQLKYLARYLGPSHGPPILSILADVYHGYNILNDPYIISLRQKAFDTTDETRANVQRELEKLLTNRKTYIHEQLKKLYTRALGIFNDLGEPATEFYIRSCIVKFDVFLAKSSHLLFDWSEKEGNNLHDMLSLVAASQPISPNLDVHENLSPKMYALIDLLLSEAKEGFTGIIFVEQRATVAAMDHVLSNHPQLRELFNVGTFVGTSMTVHRKSHLGIGDLVEVKHQQQTLDDFRAGKKNLIVATSVLEEGIDVSNCHIVICYEPPKNLKSFIQRRGRARKQDSKFVIMLPEDSTLAQSPGKWLDLEEQMKEAYLNDLREVQAAEEREQLDEEGDDTYRCESTGALLTLDNAMQHLYHFCAILGGGQHVDLRPRFSFADVSADLITATVTLPTSVDAKIRQHRGVSAWKTERAARRDAAFQAYVALHKAGLVNDNLLPLLNDQDDEPDFGIIDKRPAMVQVAPHIDPWLPVAKTISEELPSTLWYRTRISILVEAQPVIFVVLLPQPTLKVPDFVLHWNESIRYTLTSEPMEPVHLSADEVKQLQCSTRALLYSIFGSRMTEERYDFLYLIATYDVSRVNQLGAFANECRPALEVYAELQAGLKPTIGILRQKGTEQHLLIFRSFQTVEVVDMTTDGPPAENGDESLIHIVYSGFPKRRDFLHPMRDTAQHGMYSKEHILPACDFLIDSSPASYSIFTAFLPSVLHRFELFLTVQQLCETALKPIGFVDHEMVLRAITASSTNEQDYQRLEFLGDTILKYSTAVQLMAEHLQWPESYLTERKDRIVSNGSLAKASRRVGLDKFIFTKSFTGAKWRPRYIHDVLTLAAVENPEKRPISTKILADVVESLIGTAYIEGGMLKAHRCISTFLASVPWRPLHECRNILSIQAASEHASAPPLHLESVEELIGYTFTNKYLLLEALTHPSFTSYREAATSSYQRLEFLGDAVLDYLVSRRLYAHRNPAPPNAAYALPPRGHAAFELPHGTLHSIRSALVNASFLAFLCMEATLLEPRAAVAFTPQPHSTTALGTATPVPAPPSARALHHFMRHSAPTLQAASAAAAARHAARREAIWAALRGAARYPWPALAAVGAEKFFSDVVEAVLGAVFVDSAGTEGEGGGMEACEAFLVRLGLVGVLERVLRDGVDTLHPRLELGRLAGSEKVVWGWGEGEGVEKDGRENDGGENEDEGQGGGKAGGVVRCRVGIGERWVGGWVEGPSRLAAQTEAADRAVLTLRAEKAARKVGVMQDDEEGGLEGESADDDKSESEVDQAMSGVETEVGQDVIMGET